MSDTLQELYGRKGRVITDRDAHDITRVEELSYDLKVADVMSREVHFLAPTQTMQDVFEVLRKNRISGAPIVEKDKLAGIISQEDLMRALADGKLDTPIRQYMTK